MELTCPHCGSDKGYYTLNHFSEVPVEYDFNGNVRKIVVKMDDSTYRRKDAYCICCNQVISTIREMELQVRKQCQHNPIARYRTLSGYTQVELATELGCSRSAVAEWEQRNSLPRNKELIAKMDRLFKNPAFMREIKEYYGYGGRI